MLLASKHGSGEPGLTPDSTSLEDESCDFSHEGLLASFARNLMRAFHVWDEQGFAPIAQDYLSRLTLRGKMDGRASIADNGDLILTRAAAGNECLAFLPALEEAPWLDRLAGRPRL
jgi:biotin-(acetyl-CoA carboxylase) ligase